MGLSRLQVQEIAAAKGLTCLNIEEYKNLTTNLMFECEHGHRIITNIKSIRNDNFSCPFCTGADSVDKKLNSIEPPPKQGYRIIGLDNATEKVGVSIYDDGKLVFYHLFEITGETVNRLVKNGLILEHFLIEKCQPDFFIIEDIQYQNNVNTFKVLAMLLGATVTTIKKHNIPYDTVLSTTWRSHFLISQKKRTEQKTAAIKLISQMYNITVNDDVAEAILIGKYGVDMKAKKSVKLF